VKRNITLLYGFSFFDPFMIVIPVWVPYLATQGITMRQFMELQAVFAVVILCGEVPSGLLSDLWGRKKTLLLGSTLKAVSFSLLPLWHTYEGFLVYHLTMGIALSMISGGDVALLYDSHLAAGGERSRGPAVLGNMKLAGQTGAGVSALLGGAIVALSYGHLLWANALLSWIPMLLVLGVTEPRATLERRKKWSTDFKEVLSGTFVRDPTTRLVFLNLVASGAAGLVMVWTHQKYWQDSGVPLASFGVLFASYNLIFGFAGKIRRARERTIWPAIPVGRDWRLAHRCVFRHGVVLRVGRDRARNPGPGRSGFSLRGLSECAEREALVRVPRDRDLDGPAGDARLLRAPRPPGGLWDRPLGIAVRLVGARHPVLDRLHLPAPSAGRAGDTAEPGRSAHRVLAGPTPGLGPFETRRVLSARAPRGRKPEAVPASAR
jgi:MFS family permease